MAAPRDAPTRFHLYGAPIAASPSPAVHNAGTDVMCLCARMRRSLLPAAFQAAGLAYTYSLHETSAIDEGAIRLCAHSPS